MLTGIPPILSPELFTTMMEMGHGDELVLADGNFPAAACARRLIRADGHGVAPLLCAVLPFFPLDTYVRHPVGLMAVCAGDPEPAIWKTYAQALKGLPGWPGEFAFIERFEFYERARRAFAVVATGELAPYANIILTKGCVRG